MRIVINGGAGFIGCNAAAHFKRAHHDVTVVDNLSRVGSDANARWLTETLNIPVTRLDLREAEPIEAVIARLEPDVVLHCAGQVAVTTSVTDPRRDFEDNALGTLNMLEAVRRRAPGAIVIYTSTNKVYGGMEDVGVVLRDGRYQYADLARGCDERRPLDFHSPYGCSKGAADQYVRDYARIYGLRTVVFRQSCIYGYRQFGVEDQGWVAWFTIRAAFGAPVTIFGDGRQVRDVLFIDDLVNAFEAAIAHIDVSAGRIYNIGGGPGNQLSLLELVDRLDALTGRKLAVSFADWRPGDQRVFVCDIGKAKAELGWAPRVGSHEGVERLYRWVDANRGLFSAAMTGGATTGGPQAG
ncbi:MAG TPA: FAD-dependent oxidoreductase [Polyangia bacterium]|nr:FAD-dependent oxidoreductase [Polyangia bacterium]